MSPRYITHDELAKIIKAPENEPHRDYLVIDVRDDDYRGGNIKHAKNIPSNEFLMHVDQLVKQTKETKLVVFHCALSQVRGPKAARIYKETYGHLQNEGDPVPDIAILRDGFTLFQEKYKDDPDLVENWDKEVWGNNWYNS